MSRSVCENMVETLNGFGCPCLHSSVWNLIGYGDVCAVWIGDALLGFPKGESYVGNPLQCDYSSHSEHLMLGQYLANWPCSWHWKHLSSSFVIMLIIDSGVMVAVSCCTALCVSTSDMASLSICSPFLYMWAAKLWAFFKC